MDHFQKYGQTNWKIENFGKTTARFWKMQILGNTSFYKQAVQLKIFKRENFKRHKVFMKNVLENRHLVYKLLIHFEDKSTKLKNINGLEKQLVHFGNTNFYDRLLQKNFV